MNRPQAPGHGPEASGLRSHSSGRRPPVLLASFAVIVALVGQLAAQSPAAAPVRGLSHATALASAYGAILNADFDQVTPRMATACVTVPAWCTVMEAVSLWWQIALEPDQRRRDPLFTRTIDSALEATGAWTMAEPQRGEAWFARGAAYGARAQWRVLRGERLAAARDGKHIRHALDRALTIDPELHDAKFGRGMYRYYADVAPAALRLLRWLLLLPGGDRKAGLQEMQFAREHGLVIRGEADYQLHLIYLWYEQRSHDALALIRGLEDRYPGNPLFTLIAAEIHDVYFHDANTSEAVLRALITRAEAGRVNASPIAIRRARAAIDVLHTRARR